MSLSAGCAARGTALGDPGSALVAQTIAAMMRDFRDARDQDRLRKAIAGSDCSGLPPELMGACDRMLAAGLSR